MTKEYIERDAFIAEQRHLYCENCERRKGMKNGKMKFVYAIGEAPCRACDIGDVLDDVEDYPAADVAPVRHGRWEYDEEAGEYYCSECHRTTDDRHDEIQEYDGKKVIALCLPRFCGYCGAKMDGGQNDV